MLCYLALGSLIQSFTLKVSFIDALYFAVVSIETIGKDYTLDAFFLVLITQPRFRGPSSHINQHPDLH